MLSDDSSSESETGRFKSSSKVERSSKHSSSQQHLSRPPRGTELLPDLVKNKNNDRSFGRERERRNEDRNRFERRRSRDRYESSRRHSPPKRRYSRDRSRDRFINSRDNDEHYRYRESGRDITRSDKAKNCDRDTKISDSAKNDRFSRKRSQSPGLSVKRDKKTYIEQKSTVSVRNSSKNENEELKLKNITKKELEEKDKISKNKESSRKRERSASIVKVCETNSRNKSENRIPKSVPLKDKSVSSEKEVNRSKSRRYSTVEEISDLEEPASYYNTVILKTDKVEKDVVHSLTDSSEDEEKLRAKLLNLEKELDKSRKKKSKKSNKKSKSKHRDKDENVEVSSTTDIQEKESEEKKSVELQTDVPEVSSTQIRIQKDSSEEGEICSDEESTNVIIDPSDLRHKLIKSVASNSASPDQPDKSKSRTEVTGPALPPHMQTKIECSISPEVEGPRLPPHLQRQPVVGPSIPADLRKKLAEAPQEVHISSSEDEGIGPLPQDAEGKWTVAHKKLEERALRMKITELEGGLTKSDVIVREEWMLELPEAKAKHLGLGPRQFRTKEGPDMSDRSSWTDTPQLKALKAAGVVPPEEASTTVLQQEASRRYVDERDRDQEKAVKKHKKKHKRDESLLDMHQKKLKKKKKKDEKEEDSKGRRPFDRDTDLQANRFDDAQKRSIIKKAQHLDTRFSSGQAKFL